MTSELRIDGDFLGGADYRAVAAHDAGDEDGEVEDAEDGFEEGYGACLARDGGNAGCAEFGDSAEAEVDEIEAVGDLVEVGDGIEEEGIGLQADDETVDTGKDEAQKKVDRERAEDGFGGWFLLGVDAPEEDGEDDGVEDEAEEAVDESDGAGRQEKDALQERGNGEAEEQDNEIATRGNGVDGEQNDEAAEDAEGVVAQGAALGVGVDGDGEQQEDEENGETVAGHG